MLTFALVAASSVALLPGTEIALSGRQVTLADVVRTAGTEGATVIARLPAERRSVTLRRSALAALVRRALPGLTVSGVDSGTVTLRAPEVATEIRQDCRELVVAVAEGAVILERDVVPVPCDGTPSDAIAFDRAGSSLKAAADLPAGSFLGRVRLASAPGVATGDRMVLLSSAGAVRIERSVVALQPGRSGGRIFVRTDDGDILAAPLPEVDE